MTRANRPLDRTARPLSFITAALLLALAPANASAKPVQQKVEIKKENKDTGGGLYATARSGYGVVVFRAGGSALSDGVPVGFAKGPLFNLTLGYRFHNREIGMIYDIQGLADSTGALHQHTFGIERIFPGGMRIRAGLGVMLLHGSDNSKVGFAGSMGFGWQWRLAGDVQLEIDLPLFMGVFGSEQSVASTGAGLQLGLTFGSTR